jgi:hypothetical protein
MSSVLNVIITDAGIAEVINAQHTGTAPVVLSQVGFGRGIYTPTADQTALHDEIKRVSTIAGGVVGSNIMHIQALDSGESAYAVYEIGVYTASGTLFAVYSQPMPILHKVANSSIMCVIDFVLSGVEPTAVTVGDTDYTLAPATPTNQGVVELATVEETTAGTDTERAVTPADAAAVYVAIAKEQAVTGKKTFTDAEFEALKLGRMELSRNIISSEDRGVLEIYKNDSDNAVINNNYYVAGNYGSYLINVRNISGNPNYDGAEMGVAHTNTYASATNKAFLRIASSVANTWHGFSIQYDSTAAKNVAAISADLVNVDGHATFNDGITGDVTGDLTGKIPQPTYDGSNTSVTAGCIFMGWVAPPRNQSSLTLYAGQTITSDIGDSNSKVYPACYNDGTWTMSQLPGSLLRGQFRALNDIKLTSASSGLVLLMKL